MTALIAKHNNNPLFPSSKASSQFRSSDKYFERQFWTALTSRSITQQPLISNFHTTKHCKLQRPEKVC